jgi:hypothetical protein
MMPFASVWSQSESNLIIALPFLYFDHFYLWARGLWLLLDSERFNLSWRPQILEQIHPSPAAFLAHNFSSRCHSFDWISDHRSHVSDWCSLKSFEVALNIGVLYNNKRYRIYSILMIIKKIPDLTTQLSKETINACSHSFEQFYL